MLFTKQTKYVQRAKLIETTKSWFKSMVFITFFAIMTITSRLDKIACFYTNRFDSKFLVIRFGSFRFYFMHYQQMIVIGHERPTSYKLTDLSGKTLRYFIPKIEVLDSFVRGVRSSSFMLVLSSSSKQCSKIFGHNLCRKTFFQNFFMNLLLEHFVFDNCDSRGRTPVSIQEA